MLHYVERSKLESLFQIKSEVNHWKNVLKIIVAAVIFLTSSVLAFCATNEIFGSQNNGNYNLGSNTLLVSLILFFLITCKTAVIVEKVEHLVSLQIFVISFIV